MDEIVVVADRTPTLQRQSVAATSVLTRSDIEKLHAGSLWEVLQHVPGLTFVDRDGSGQLPMAIARGFFGGGETSYVLLTVDGVPINDVRTGLAEWTQIPVSEIDRIEVLRGSASTVYGDAALGAVVNVITGGPVPPRVRAAATLGGWGETGLSATADHLVGGSTLRASIDLGRGRGYRDHSKSNRFSSSLAYALREQKSRSLRARLTVSRLENEEPGALAPGTLSEDSTRSHPAFAGDTRTRTFAQAHISAGGDLGQQRHFEATLRLRAMGQDRVRTLLLTPSFGDTQVHDESDLGIGVRAQYTAPLTKADLTLGAEADVSTYDSRYRVPGDGLHIWNDGGGRLWKGAIHGDLRGSLSRRVKLHTGARLDLVRPQNRAVGAAMAPTFKQWSPRLALNLVYRESRSSVGHLFATWSRAFKSPSLDQLYDVRQIPTGQPGISINLSSPELQPQRSSVFEVGLYQKVPLRAPHRHAAVSLSAYQQVLDDEIDFDIRTFGYGNIQESRHRGFEASVRGRLSRRLEVDHAATVIRATFRSGEYEGKQLKNIPQLVLVSSVYARITDGCAATLTHRNLGGSYLDDANTRRLQGTNLLDAGLRWAAFGLEMSVTVRNLLDSHYESHGFLLFDPAAGTDVPMTFPGSGRQLRARLTIPGGAL